MLEINKRMCTYLILYDTYHAQMAFFQGYEYLKQVYDDLLKSSERENDDFVEKLGAAGLREPLRVLS